METQSLGKRTLKFQSDWFKKLPWLHCDRKSGKVLCFECVTAVHKGLVNPSNYKMETSSNFRVEGFSNWKKAIERFDKHQKSLIHRDAHLKLAGLKQKDVMSSMEEKHERDQESARKALISIITSLKYLVTEGSAVRGKENSGGKFKNLLIAC